MLQIRVLIGLRNKGDGLGSGAKGPAPVRGTVQGQRVVAGGLGACDPGMTNDAGPRTNEVLRREYLGAKYQERKRYQVKRPLYWNWRPR